MSQPKKKLTPLTDDDNLVMVDVTPEKEQGLSVEDAYRHLAGMPPAPVLVDKEEEE
jgi:hypothetical protein